MEISWLLIDNTTRNNNHRHVSYLKKIEINEHN